MSVLTSSPISVLILAFGILTLVLFSAVLYSVFTEPFDESGE